MPNYPKLPPRPTLASSKPFRKGDPAPGTSRGTGSGEWDTDLSDEQLSASTGGPLSNARNDTKQYRDSVLRRYKFSLKHGYEPPDSLKALNSLGKK